MSIDTNDQDLKQEIKVNKNPRTEGFNADFYVNGKKY